MIRFLPPFCCLWLGTVLLPAEGHAQRADIFGTPLPHQEAYLKQRPPSHRGLRRQSLYVPATDGTRLAVDVYLPGNRKQGEKLPCILYQTRYVRSLQLKGFYRLLRRYVSTNVGMDEIRFFVARGYAVVVADTRGSGASFGHRRMEISPQEVADGAAICSWVVAQPWSNGAIGTSGVSYVGTTAVGILANAHPAVKAVFPRCPVWDTYADIAYPGGVRQQPFIDIWGYTTQSLDHNRYDGFGKQAKTFVKGTNPVDADRRRRSLLAQALKEHEANFNIIENAPKVDSRNDGTEQWGLNIDSCSVHRYLPRLRPQTVPVHWMSGWYDGALTRSAVNGFRSLDSAYQWLTLGPWAHGPEDNASPWAASNDLNYHVYAEMLRFFDQYLLGKPNQVERDPRVRYFVQGLERWLDSPTWPPPAAQAQWVYLTDNQSLEPQAQRKPTQQLHRPNMALNTGWRSRYNSQTTLYKHGRTGYAPSTLDSLYRLGMAFRTEPMPENVVLAGNPRLQLRLAANAPDAQVFAYLLQQDPDGRLHYITEGMLRAVHRTPGPAPYPDVAPHRSFTRSAMQPLVPNEATDLELGLLPVAWQLPGGSRLVLVLAGADALHFAPLPQGPSEWQVSVGGPHSRLELPLLPAQVWRSSATNASNR